MNHINNSIAVKLNCFLVCGTGAWVLSLFYYCLNLISIGNLLLFVFNYAIIGLLGILNFNLGIDETLFLNITI
jgi:hypothetical protein